MRNDHLRAKREECSGWSAKSARSNTRFLQSVKLESLTGVGIAFTLTLKNCPATADEWHKLRRAFAKRIERAGMIRLHWVTEWQRRGVPHLHGVAYFPDDRPSQYWSGLIVTHWLDLAAPYVCAVWAQNAKPITDALGWVQYLAKHASRGAGHYQRSRENIPEGWREKTGRMWGKWGEWEVGDPLKFNVPMPAMHAHRRLFRRWQISEARSKGDWRGVKYSRRCLRCHIKTLSTVRGVAGWIPEDVQLAMVHWLAASGYTVESV